MENNEISSFMDAKLDINEKTPEAVKLRSWTKCLVKIEAIKCFPCYLRITFIRNVENESANLCVRINIPGVNVRLTSSRTKDYSYGVFWKQNRKQHRIYFAFDSKLNCDHHMKWLKKSLKNLELHRLEILETKRSSRDNISLARTEKISLSQASNDYPNIYKKNLQDILGPLPNIPDRDSNNWARRISGISGIYEEIPFDRRDSRESGIYEEMKISKNQKPLAGNTNLQPPPLPPRTRINTYQSENDVHLPRCSTNPEIDLARTRQNIINSSLERLNRIGSCFGRSQRSESVSEGKVSTAEELFCNEMNVSIEYCFENKSKATPRHRRKFFDLKESKAAKNKRNSFSSPDLSKMNPFENFEALDDLSSISSDLFNSSDCFISADNLNNDLCQNDISLENLNKIEFKLNDKAETDPLNISEQIQSNFNFSCNSSTINLVGASLNDPVTVLEEDLSGYCAMAPIKDKKNNSEHIKFKKVDENLEIERNRIRSSSLYCFMAPIQKKFKDSIKNQEQGADSKEDNSPYCAMSAIQTNVSKYCDKQNSVQKNGDSDKENDSENTSPLKMQQQIGNFYENCQVVQTEDMQDVYQNWSPVMLRRNKASDLIHQESPVLSDKSYAEDKEEDYYKTPRRTIISVDDKVPSYYPNSCDTKKCIRNSYGRSRLNSTEKTIRPDSVDVPHLVNLKVRHCENFYISSPQKILDQRSRKCDSLKALKISDNIYSVKKVRNSTKEEISKNETDTKSTLIEIAVHNIDFKFDDSGEFTEKFCRSVSPVQQQKRIYQKYSTISRTSNSNKCNKLIDKNQQSNSDVIKPKSPDLNTFRKFTSLPRFKRFDFSPLKLKINNVLQRNHSDGL